jgi:hypothetical protein
MKTIGKLLGGKLLTYASVFVFLSLASCQDRLEFDGNDSDNVENEASTDSYFEDTDDMATLSVSVESGAVSGRETSGGRMGVKPTDLRFTCATVTYEAAADNSTTTPHGYITIDFGTGCTDTKGNTRKGKIKVEFTGRRFIPGSTIVTILDGYVVNGVALEGKRTVTNIAGSTEDNPKFSIVLTGGKATWTATDGTVTTASREVNRTREWIRATVPANDQWIVGGSAAGVNRKGKVYEMTITKPLVYKRECALGSRVFMAVEGTKELVVDGKKITIDYGTGTCDRLVTITVNGKSKEIEVRGEI